MRSLDASRSASDSRNRGMLSQSVAVVGWPCRCSGSTPVHAPSRGERAVSQTPLRSPSDTP